LSRRENYSKEKEEGGKQEGEKTPAVTNSPATALEEYAPPRQQIHERK
jgi:hypothetical protein